MVKELLTQTTRTHFRKDDKKCHLLDLPPELRNRIYSHVALDSCKTYPWNRTPENIVGENLCTGAPDLLFANKQIHSEFSSLYYSPEFFPISLWSPRSKQWTDVSDRRLIQAFCQGKYFHHSCFAEDGDGGPMSAIRRDFETAYREYHLMNGIVDLERFGAGRLELIRIPYAILGPSFELKLDIDDERW